MGLTCSRFLVRALTGALLAAALCAPAVGSAQDADAQSKAREHYQKGKDLYEAEQYAEAKDEFQAAYDAKPHPVVLKSVAECQVQMLDIKAAIATFEKYLAAPEAADKPEIEKRLAEVRGMLGKVEITTEPPGAGVVLDGTVTGEVTPVTMELNPGDHELALNLDGYEPLIKPLTLDKGASATVAVDFAAEGTPAAAPAEPDLVDPFAEEGEGDADDLAEPEFSEEEEGPPPAFWVAAAVTGVGLVSGTVFGTMALGDEEDYKKNPTKDIKDNGERNAIIADVSFGVAAAAAIVGAVILVTDDGDEAEASVGKSSPSLQVTPVATDDTVGVSTAVTF